MTDTGGMPNSGEGEALYGSDDDMTNAGFERWLGLRATPWVSEMKPVLLRSRKFLSAAELFLIATFCFWIVYIHYKTSVAPFDERPLLWNQARSVMQATRIPIVLFTRFENALALEN